VQSSVTSIVLLMVMMFTPRAPCETGWGRVRVTHVGHLALVDRAGAGNRGWRGIPPHRRGIR
jgi:hypothetical protein